MEANSGNLNGRWTGGAAQKVEDVGTEKDGHVFVYLTADWRDTALNPPPFKINKREKIPISITCLGPEHWLLQCTAVIVLRGSQCAPIHLNLVGHIREWLWSITDPQTSQRLVEGSGMADYLNLIWCAPSHHKFYRDATREHGIYEFEWGVEGESWDAFWYIYRRNYPTPSYAHIGLDKSASFNAQKHVAAEVKTMIQRAYTESISRPALSDKKKWLLGRLF